MAIKKCHNLIEHEEQKQAEDFVERLKSGEVPLIFIYEHVKCCFPAAGVSVVDCSL